MQTKILINRWQAERLKEIEGFSKMVQFMIDKQMESPDEDYLIPTDYVAKSKVNVTIREDQRGLIKNLSLFVRNHLPCPPENECKSKFWIKKEFKVTSGYTRDNEIQDLTNFIEELIKSKSMKSLQEKLGRSRNWVKRRINFLIKWGFINMCGRKYTMGGNIYTHKKHLEVLE